MTKFIQLLQGLKNSYLERVTILGCGNVVYNRWCMRNQIQKKRQPTFGTKAQMGELAEKYWYEMPEHFSFVKMDEFVVMPNHVHGIIIIDKPFDDNANVETRLIASLPVQNHQTESKIPGGITGNNNPMLHENISRMIRWYKGRCSFEIRKIHADFAWQSRFHDHIIRNHESYERIKNYIINNPQKWADDTFNNSNNKHFVKWKPITNLHRNY